MFHVFLSFAGDTMIMCLALRLLGRGHAMKSSSSDHIIFLFCVCLLYARWFQWGRNPDLDQETWLFTGQYWKRDWLNTTS